MTEARNVRVDLSRFDNSWYDPGAPKLIRILWFFAGLPLLRSSSLPGSEWRSRLLRLFGAKIGKGLVIKPGVRVKSPWFFEVGDHCWIGEDCWIDNLALVRLGNHVCLSQGVYLCTGNHNWKDPFFGLMVGPIRFHDGSWAGAKAVLCPGVELLEGAVAGAGSVVSRDIPAWEIHLGNPAAFSGKRILAGADAQRP